MKRVVIECDNLTKKINNCKIIDNISFKLYEGDILGFIGANGTGKTTAIKTMLGLYKIDSGSFRIMGYDIEKDFEKAISYVGAIIENPDMYSYMTGYENLRISQRLYNIPTTRLKEVIRLVGLEDKIKEKVSKYSLGMKQRLGIAQAIIHNPKVLILDEPTNGLDPEGINQLKQLLIKLSKQGMVIIVSSHILKELESFCNKVCIIDQGKVVRNTTIEELRRLFDKNNYILELSSVNLDNILLSYEVLDEKYIKLSANDREINNIIKALVLNNIEIYEIKKQVLSLEDIYLSQIGGSF